MRNQEKRMSFAIFPQKLQEAMDAKGWNQKKLEEVSTISQGTISNYLRGKRDPSASQLHILADSLGVRMEWLLIGEGWRTIDEHVEACIAGSEGTLSKDDRGHLRQAAEEVDAQLIAAVLMARAVDAEGKLAKVAKSLKTAERSLQKAQEEVKKIQKLLE